MPRTFSPSRALGIPAKDYSDYFDGEDAPLAFNPDRGYSARPSMVTPFDAFGQQFGQFAADRALQTLDAQKDLLNTGAESLVSPQGRAKRLDYMLKDAISPQQERTIEHFEEPAYVPQPNKYSPVPVEVARAASELDYIDPTEPDALEKRNKILRDIDTHPEFGGTNLKTHPYFQDKDQKFLHNYYAHKNLAGTAERGQERTDVADIHRALTSDVPADALKPYLDPDMRRIVDHAGFADVLAKAAHNKSVLTPKVKQHLVDLQTAAQSALVSEPSVEQKQAWLSGKGIESPTDQDWAQAYQALKTEPVQAYHSFRDSLGLHDLSPPAAAPPSSSSAAPAAPGPSVTAPPAAILYLQQHPDAANFFDAKYGAGAAQRILGGAK